MPASSLNLGIALTLSTARFRTRAKAINKTLVQMTKNAQALSNALGTMGVGTGKVGAVGKAGKTRSGNRAFNGSYSGLSQSQFYEMRTKSKNMLSSIKKQAGIKAKRIKLETKLEQQRIKALSSMTSTSTKASRVSDKTLLTESMFVKWRKKGIPRDASRAQRDAYQAYRQRVSKGEARIESLGVQTGYAAERVKRVKALKKENAALAAQQKKADAKALVEKKKAHTKELNSQKKAAREKLKAQNLSQHKAQDAVLNKWRSSMLYSTIGLSVGMGLSGLGRAGMNNIIKPSLDKAGKFRQKQIRIDFMSRGRGGGSQPKGQAAWILDFASKSLFTPEMAQVAFEGLVQSGLPSSTARKAMMSVHDYAMYADQLDNTAPTVKLLASSLAKFKHSSPQLQGDQAQAFGKMTDMYAQTTRTSLMRPEGVLPFINALGAAPAKWGIPLADTLGIGGMLSTQGKLPAEAGHSIQILLRRLLHIKSALLRAESGTNSDLIRNLGFNDKTVARVNKTTGVNSKKVRQTMSSAMMAGVIRGLDVEFFDKAGSFKGIMTVIKDIESGVAREFGDKQESRLVAMNLLFGQQGSEIIELTRNFEYMYDGVTHKGIDALELYIKTISKARGQMEEFRKETLGAWDAQNKLINDAVEAIQISLGSNLIDLIKPAQDFILYFSNTVKDFLQRQPMATKAIVALIGGFSSLALITGSAMVALFGFSTAVQLTGYFVTKAGTKLVSFSAAMELLRVHTITTINAMLPLNWTVARLWKLFTWTGAGIGVGLVAYLTNLGGVMDWVNEKFADFKRFYGLAKTYLKNGGFNKAELGMLMGVDPKTGVGGKRKDLSGAMNIFLTIYRSASAILTGMRAGFMDFVKDIGPAAKRVADVFWQIVDVFARVFGVDGLLKNGTVQYEKLNAVAKAFTRALLYLVEGPLRLFASIMGVVADVLENKMIKGFLVLAVRVQMLSYVIRKVGIGFLALKVIIPSIETLCTLFVTLTAKSKLFWGVLKGIEWSFAGLKAASLLGLKAVNAFIGSHLITSTLAALSAGFALGTWVAYKFGRVVDGVSLAVQGLVIALKSIGNAVGLGYLFDFFSQGSIENSGRIMSSTWSSMLSGEGAQRRDAERIAAGGTLGMLSKNTGGFLGIGGFGKDWSTHVIQGNDGSLFDAYNNKAFNAIGRNSDGSTMFGKEQPFLSAQDKEAILRGYEKYDSGTKSIPEPVIHKNSITVYLPNVPTDVATLKRQLEAVVEEQAERNGDFTLNAY